MKNYDNSATIEDILLLLEVVKIGYNLIIKKAREWQQNIKKNGQSINYFEILLKFDPSMIHNDSNFKGRCRFINCNKGINQMYPDILDIITKWESIHSKSYYTNSKTQLQTEHALLHENIPTLICQTPDMLENIIEYDLQQLLNDSSKVIEYYQRILEGVCELQNQIREYWLAKLSD